MRVIRKASEIKIVCSNCGSVLHYETYETNRQIFP